MNHSFFFNLTYSRRPNHPRKRSWSLVAGRRCRTTKLTDSICLNRSSSLSHFIHSDCWPSRSSLISILSLILTYQKRFLRFISVECLKIKADAVKMPGQDLKTQTNTTFAVFFPKPYLTDILNFLSYSLF